MKENTRQHEQNATEVTEVTVQALVRTKRKATSHGLVESGRRGCNLFDRRFEGDGRAVRSVQSER